MIEHGADSSPHVPIPAEIVEVGSYENGHTYKVRTFVATVHLLRGLGAPRGGYVGQRGTIQYRTGPSYGLYFWTPEEETT